ncbi:hypothetical protein G6R29_01175 [Fructobacillus sp. M2-14]|uniref:Uncharacterized protein n=1 Tax=Fructobacillus broussonetiae TaxID=2713173 RepID=A0ABS5QYT2_9LACO|nr:hypothetical protein [Fructobacillus broussonetiae]MBS9338246.1 hypothetical protein [Fructobacillus broussonetiae]
MPIALTHNTLKEDLQAYLDDLKAQQGGHLNIPCSHNEYPYIHRDSMELIKIVIDGKDGSLDSSIAAEVLEERDILPSRRNGLDLARYLKKLNERKEGDGRPIPITHDKLKDDLRAYLESEKSKQNGELIIPVSDADYPLIYRDSLELMQIAIDSPEESIDYAIACDQLEERGYLPHDDAVFDKEAFWADIDV